MQSADFDTTYGRPKKMHKKSYVRELKTLSKNTF